MICDNITVSESGRLLFAGQDTVELARQYGTPLYLMDEDKIRENCRVYAAAFQKHFGDRARPLYASKANSFKRIYEIMKEEQMGIDVVSSGEIYTALQAGYDLSRAYFHSNNKTDEDIRYSMENGIGYFVADNVEEIRAIEAEAARRGVRQKVLLRLTPGIDPHTYEAIATGKVDSKFGSAIETGQAEEITAFTLQQPHVELVGFHCHVGSQVFAEDVFERAAVIMLEFVAAMKNKYGYMAQQLDLGGGYGVRYVESDPDLDVDTKVGEVAAAIRQACARLEIDLPEIHMEPGRSIVGAAGMTLYTAGTVKKIPGYKNYVSVDGGMPDNPRFALYGASYTCLLANKMNEPAGFECSVVGRCCESGDIIQEHVMLPASVGRGDIVAVCTTGAYNYSMASNYNRLPRPPIVMLRGGGEHYVAVRRESLEDLCRNDR
ncbi:diaminopimelate decarboxylase [Flavonifractor sp. DFI.6.63]|uniref:diaminopimelate decarboxylase n=1 Tax=Flavonifractor sp. DFI.6.63 TaxID=2963704 RepID=UPI00210A1447|nr:diaminopimelate decarboxylase [Flavonifractor sp. DFI.6.63]MCQ5030449.1 diaminopimelate decarboxylase [Flavonifractor sp. DFI.6.63]